MTAEVRLTDDDFHDVLRWTADCLDGAGSRVGEGHCPVIMHFAAEGSAYDLLLAPYESVCPARPEASFPVAKGHSDAVPGALYVVRDAWFNQAGAWKGSAMWGPDVISEHFCNNIVDALPLAILLAELDLVRFRIPRDEHLHALYSQWILWAANERYQNVPQMLVTEVPGAWIEYQDGGIQVDVGMLVLGWFK